MKKYMILPLLLVILISFSASTESWGNKDWQWWEDGAIGKELGLSEDQLAKTKEISAKFNPMLKKAGRNYYEKRTAYQDAKSNPDTSTGDVIKAFDSMWDSKYKMMRIKLDRDLEIKAVLTPEQVNKLNEIRKAHKEKMMKKYHKMIDEKQDKKAN